jgi:putative nucleotidyltransferase-like protein
MRAYDQHHHLPPLCDAQVKELQLEIHTALFPERQPFAFEARDLWAGAKPLGPMFPNTSVPQATHSLLHACLHFLWSHQGRFGTWRTIRDVDFLARTQNVDWTAFVATARATRGGTSCYWTFRIAERTAGVSVPAFVLDQLRPPRSAYLLQAIERHFARNLFPTGFSCPSVSLGHALWELAVMPGWSGHGKIRPWDADPQFVPSGDSSKARAVPRSERIRRFLALPGYVGMLLRSQE